MIFKEKTGLDNIDIDIEYIDIDIEYLEQIKSYKYLGSSLNRYNYIREEIKGRIKSWTIKLIAQLLTYLLKLLTYTQTYFHAYLPTYLLA